MVQHCLGEASGWLTSWLIEAVVGFTCCYVWRAGFQDCQNVQFFQKDRKSGYVTPIVLCCQLIEDFKNCCPDFKNKPDGWVKTLGCQFCTSGKESAPDPQIVLRP